MIAIWIGLQFYLIDFCEEFHMFPFDDKVETLSRITNFEASLALFNPNKTGRGDGGPPPSTFCVITLQRAKLSLGHFMTIFFWISHTFWHQILMRGGTVPKLHNLLYMHVRPEKAQNVILCTKSMQNLFFFT